MARIRALRTRTATTPSACSAPSSSAARATRSDLLRALASETFEGVTGAVRFAPDHTRADAPPLYIVDGETIRTLR